MNKAGSTAIQAKFRDYEDAKTEYFGGRGTDHSELFSLACLESPSPAFLPDPSPAGIAAARADAIRRLDQGLSASQRGVVISSEFLSEFPDVDSCRRAVDLLRRHVDRIEALVYVRDPASFIKSALQQVLKIRRAPPLATLWPNYRARFLRWEEALTPEPLRYVIFHPSAFHDGDLILDFAQRAGLRRGFAERRRGTANVSLSAEATAVLHAFRERHGDADRQGPDRRTQARMVFALKSFGQSGFSLAPAAIAAIMSDKADEMAWIEGRLGAPLRSFDEDAKISFQSLDAIAEYAETLRQPLLEWQREAVPEARIGAGAGVADIVDAVRAAIAERPDEKAS